MIIKKAESEKALERRLVDEVRKMGGVALKQTSQFHKGVPDRIVLLPFHTICFVELKSTGGKQSEPQKLFMERLKGMYFRCFVIDSTEALEDFVRRMQVRLAKFQVNDQQLVEEMDRSIETLRAKFKK